ncbi:hypothetical protein BVY03_00045 [bacterium K02(2017)]|nr:hypothetical protein BVY03_00045 [bacterium K02(2017)]
MSNLRINNTTSQCKVTESLREISFPKKARFTVNAKNEIVGMMTKTTTITDQHKTRYESQMTIVKPDGTFVEYPKFCEVKTKNFNDAGKTTTIKQSCRSYYGGMSIPIPAPKIHHLHQSRLNVLKQVRDCLNDHLKS